MGQCCAANPGDQNELNDIKKPVTVSGTEDEQSKRAENNAAVKI